MSDEDTTVDTPLEGRNDQNPPAETQEGADGQADDTDLDFDEQDEDTFDPKRALKKIKKQNSELKNLRERAQEAEQKVSKTEQEKDQEIATLRSELLRARVGLKTGLPEQILSRLKGETEEEMMSDAEAFMELFHKNRPPAPKPTEALRGGGRPETEPEETDLSKIADRMFSR